MRGWRDGGMEGCRDGWRVMLTLMMTTMMTTVIMMVTVMMIMMMLSMMMLSMMMVVMMMTTTMTTMMMMARDGTFCIVHVVLPPADEGDLRTALLQPCCSHNPKTQTPELHACTSQMRQLVQSLLQAA